MKEDAGKEGNEGKEWPVCTTAVLVATCTKRQMWYTVSDIL